MPEGAALDIGPISLPLPNVITFGYTKNPETTTLSFGFKYDMFAVAFSTDSATGMKMAQLTVNEGVTLRRLFEGMMSIFKNDKEGGEVNEPLDGINGTESSASLGGERVGGIFNDFLDTELPEIEITLARANTGTSAHVMLTFTIDSLGIDFVLSVLFVKRNGGKKWSTVFYAGVDIPEGKFKSPLEILNVILLVAGEPDKLGFIYTKEKLRLTVGQDVPDVLPYEPNNLRKGLNMYTESDLNAKPPSGLAAIIVTTLEALAGGKDNADDLPAKCKDASNADDEDCKMSPVQKVFRDCSDNEAMSDFDMAIPIDGLSLCFSKTCGSNPDGYPVGDGGFKFMTFGIDFCSGLNPTSFELSVAVEVFAEFNLPNGEDKYGTPNPPLVAEASVRLAITLSLKQIDLTAQAILRLKGENQLWIRPFGMPNLGIIFPFSFGIGLSIVFANPMPVVTYLELKFGFMVWTFFHYYVARRLHKVFFSVPYE